MISEMNNKFWTPYLADCYYLYLHVNPN